MLFEQRHGRLGNWQFSFEKNRGVNLAQGLPLGTRPQTRHAFDANLIREVESAVIFPDATEAAALVGRPRRAKCCRLSLETYLRMPTADRSSRRREAYCPWAAAHFLLLGAFPRKDNGFLYLAPLLWNAYSAGR